jgi:hypothetical protein
MSHLQYGVSVKPEATTPRFRVSRTMLRGGLSFALAAGVGLAMATGAFANGAKPSPTPCATTAPITAPCVPNVTNTGSSYTITLPGIGTLNFTVDQTTGKVTGTPTTSGLGANYTATIKVDKDTDRIVVVFTNSADPTKSVTLNVKARPGPNGAAPVVKAKVKRVHRDDDADETENDHHESGQTTKSYTGQD